MKLATASNTNTSLSTRGLKSSKPCFHVQTYFRGGSFPLFRGLEKNYEHHTICSVLILISSDIGIRAVTNLEIINLPTVL